MLVLQLFQARLSAQGWNFWNPCTRTFTWTDVSVTLLTASMHWQDNSGKLFRRVFTYLQRADTLLTDISATAEWLHYRWINNIQHAKQYISIYYKPVRLIMTVTQYSEYYSLRKQQGTYYSLFIYSSVFFMTL